jgi:hypothetical protein
MNFIKRDPGKQQTGAAVHALCEAAQRDIALAVYGELPDDASHSLEHHLAGCGHCRQELEAVRGLRQAMSLYPMHEPSPNLLTRTRLRLEEVLDAVPRSGGMTRIVDRLFSGIARFQSAPAMASALLAIGLAGGWFGGYRMGQKAMPALAAVQVSPGVVEAQPGGGHAASEAGPRIGGIHSIQVLQALNDRPGAEDVAISYDRLVPETMTGSLDSPVIRQMLLQGAQSRFEPKVSVDPAVRADSVDLLARECRIGHKCGDGPVREALMVALRRDRDPNVRLEALEGLQPYVGEDMNVRDVVLNALRKDPDAKVRIKAVDLLQPVDSDSSVRQVLHNVADRDENPYLRTVSRQMLNGLPEIQ